MKKKKYLGFTKVALPLGWLGNMAPFPVTYMGKRWNTTEALFQALRFEDEEIREKIRAEKSPMGAKMKSKSLRKVFALDVEPLSKKDIRNMILCVKLKLEQYPELKEELKKTGDHILYEDVSSRKGRGSSLFWGAYLQDGELVGQNILARIWMKERSNL
jgi:predicted NAD-dependent protein-ADP-ribosyltransferase YbiA (DUF1768 family)